MHSARSPAATVRRCLPPPPAALLSRIVASSARTRTSPAGRARLAVGATGDPPGPRIPQYAALREGVRAQRTTRKQTIREGACPLLPTITLYRTGGLPQAPGRIVYSLSVVGNLRNWEEQRA